MVPLPEPDKEGLDPALAALAAGSKVAAGRFTLLRLIGRGGMGVVWLARDEHLREEIALKFLPPEISHDAVALDDLRRETSRSRKLTHPHIIRIHDLYKGDKEAFISMEYVEGPNLSELRLQQVNRVLTWSFLEPLVKQLCEALRYAHAEQIVHRDLKPANLMLDARGRLKLADFGIAATVSDSVSRVSMARHALSGTAAYMSPQQLDGHPAEITDDIYALGSTLYELLTSRAPFFTGDIPHQVRALPPQPIEKRLAQLRIENPVPPVVSAMIMACLAKDPENRPRSAQAVAELLDRRTSDLTAATVSAAGFEGSPVTGSGAGSTGANPVGDAALSQRQPTSARNQAPAIQAPADARQSTATGVDPPDRRRSPLVALAALLVIVAVAGGIWGWQQKKSPPNPAPAAVAPAAPEYVSLFNGRDFTGWDGDPQVWSVKDGAIAATAGTSKDRRPLAIFWRGGTVEDFELRLSFRLQSGNSGIYYRARQLPGYEVGGYQFEIVGSQTGMLLETGSDRPRRQPSRAGMVTVAQFVDGRDRLTEKHSTSSSALEVRGAFHSRQWNDVVITVRSNHVIHELNGHVMLETYDEYEQRPRGGLIALEVYGREPTAVQFRDIRLKRFTPSAPAPAPAGR